jgi:hypothetical protein
MRFFSASVSAAQETEKINKKLRQSTAVILFIFDLLYNTKDDTTMPEMEPAGSEGEVHGRYTKRHQDLWDFDRRGGLSGLKRRYTGSVPGRLFPL